jgi:GNAT superfamily N-acetyltransferase
MDEPRRAERYHGTPAGGGRQRAQAAHGAKMITYRNILPSQVMPDIQALLHAHWLETEESLSDGPAPSIEMYQACEDAGLTVAIGVFVDEDMVGYATAFVHRHLHYDVIHAQHDSMFLLQQYRSGRVGFTLMRMMEIACKEKGARFIAWHAKVGSTFEKLLIARRIAKEESIYLKEL